MPTRLLPFGRLACAALVLPPALLATQPTASRCEVSLDASQAEAVLDILATRQAKGEVRPEHWTRLFACEPYRRLKIREAAIAKQFGKPDRVLTDEAFRAFVLSDALLAKVGALQTALDTWKRANLQAAAARILPFLPSEARIRARVYPLVKPAGNSFVWEAATDPALMLYLDPSIPSARFENTLSHELHHIGMASVEAAYEAKIRTLPPGPRSAAEWMGAFGEGHAMLAAAGGPDADPQATSAPELREAWKQGMASFAEDMKALDAFLRDVAEGHLKGEAEISNRGSSFFGLQGPWYTVGYRMAQLVERRFGRAALLETMRDPRLLLRDYNRAASDASATAKAPLPLWSESLLRAVGVGAPVQLR